MVEHYRPEELWACTMKLGYGDGQLSISRSSIVDSDRFAETVVALDRYINEADGFLNVLCGMAFDQGRWIERAQSTFFCTGCRAEHRIEAMVEHIQSCPEHPMSKLRQERDDLLKELEAYRG